MKKSLGFFAFILVNSLVVFRAWEPGARNLLGVPFELPQIGLCFAMQATILLAIPSHPGNLDKAILFLYGQNKSSELQGLNVDWKSFKTARQRPK